MFQAIDKKNMYCDVDNIEDINQIWNVVRENMNKNFYIKMKNLEHFEKSIPSDWNKIQRNLYFLCDVHQLDTYLKLDIQHRYVLVSPLTEEIALDPKVTCDSFECVIITGDEAGKSVIDYNWVVHLQKQCIERHISFLFYSTGNVFKKDGKTFRIPHSLQRVQALKANLNVVFDAWYEKDVFLRLSKSKFRNSFHLKQEDKEYIQKVSMDVIEQHAYGFIYSRLSPSNPLNDGKQTPMKGHPIFIAQHATACCCRGCLKKWHNIDQNKELTAQEEGYIVGILMKWIKKEMKSNLRLSDLQDCRLQDH